MDNTIVKRTPLVLQPFSSHAMDIIHSYINIVILFFFLLEGSTFHVTVPDQPTCVLSEAVLKVATPLKVNAVSSLNGEVVMSIPFARIRRLGCQIAFDRDIVWFETCECNEEGENFAFVVVASGIERAYQIVLEYKRSIELSLLDHLIMEEGDESKFLYSFVVRSHYGHTEFSAGMREQILSSSLRSLSASGGALSLSDLNRFSRTRLSVDNSTQVFKPVPGLVSTSGSSRSSVSPHHSTTGVSSHHSSFGKGRRSLDQLQIGAHPSGNQKSLSSELYMGSRKEVLDPSRSSAPCALSKSVNLPSSSWKEQKKQKATLSDFKKGRSSVDNFDKKRLNQGRTSLSQLQQDGMLQQIRKNSKDDNIACTHSSVSNGHDRGGVSLAAYDHLVERVEDISLQSSSTYQERRKKDPAYVDT